MNAQDLLQFDLVSFRSEEIRAQDFLRHCFSAAGFASQQKEYEPVTQDETRRPVYHMRARLASDPTRYVFWRSFGKPDAVGIFSGMDLVKLTDITVVAKERS